MRAPVLIAVTCGFFAAPSLAGPLGIVKLKETGTDPMRVMTIASSGYDGRAYVGVYKINIESPGYGELVGALDSFCIDIWDRSTSAYHPYQVLPLNEAPDPGAGPMGPARASYLAALLNNEWKAGLTSIQKSALQAAVWEVVDEGRVRIWPDGTTSSNTVPALSALDVSKDSFRVSGNDDVIRVANEMLRRITLGAGFDNYLAVSDDTVPGVLGRYQDYVVRVPCVPLPASVLLGVFAAGLAGRKLRRFV